MEQVVKLEEIQDDIILVTLQDRKANNTFSKELINGIIKAFEYIEKSDKYRVIIITGYGNYFCSGGTKEELFSFYKGEIKFDDFDFYTRPLTCKIPVISAMQGHAIGGGLVFGLYADFILLGEENIYTTNFMNYGFTPGMGATYIVPKKIGEVIGNEMMFTGQNYRGKKLKERGTPLLVYPKSEILSEAIKLAKSLAEKPKNSLIILKDHQRKKMLPDLNNIIQEELVMHELTIHEEEVSKRIENLFIE